MFSLDLVAQLPDVTEDLDDLSLGLVDMELDLRDVCGLGVHQIVSDFCTEFFGFEWLTDSGSMWFTKFSAFPVWKVLETFLNEDVASENSDDIVPIEQPEWLQRGTRHHLKIVVRTLYGFEDVWEGASHFFCAAIK